MTNNTNPTGKLTFRLAKRFSSGSGSSGTYTTCVDGKATGILVRQTGFDYTLRTQVWESLTGRCVASSSAARLRLRRQRWPLDSADASSTATAPTPLRVGCCASRQKSAEIFRNRLTPWWRRPYGIHMTNSAPQPIELPEYDYEVKDRNEADRTAKHVQSCVLCGRGLTQSACDKGVGPYVHRVASDPRGR